MTTFLYKFNEIERPKNVHAGKYKRLTPCEIYLYFFLCNKIIGAI